jgi:hypothetical protein
MRLLRSMAGMFLRGGEAARRDKIKIQYFFARERANAVCQKEKAGKAGQLFRIGLRLYS